MVGRKMNYLGKIELNDLIMMNFKRRDLGKVFETHYPKRPLTKKIYYSKGRFSDRVIIAMVQISGNRTNSETNERILYAHIKNQPSKPKYLS
jgi:hypothetical protein